MESRMDPAINEVVSRDTKRQLPPPSAYREGSFSLRPRGVNVDLPASQALLPFDDLRTGRDESRSRDAACDVETANAVEKQNSVR
jgi:hypothetical protein